MFTAAAAACHQLVAVKRELASKTVISRHGCLLQKALPSTPCIAAATGVMAVARRSIATQAKLSQQEYWQAVDEYCGNASKYETGLRTAGVEPLDYEQQQLRYVQQWIEPPIQMDQLLWRPTAVVDWLKFNVHPDNITALLEGRLGDEVAFRRDDDHDSSWFGPNRSLLYGYSIDHIIPVSRGGHDKRYNYFLMPLAVNNYFGNSWTPHKVAYIGMTATLGAGSQHYGADFDYDHAQQQRRRCRRRRLQL